MTTFTPNEQSLLLQLPDKVQCILRDYPSVAQSYLNECTLPVFSRDHQFDLFEVYYDCAELPALVIKNSALTSNQRAPEVAPTIIEMMGDQGVVFIQVGDSVILNRIPGNVPEINSVVVQV